MLSNKINTLRDASPLPSITATISRQLSEKDTRRRPYQTSSNVKLEGSELTRRREGQMTESDVDDFNKIRPYLCSKICSYFNTYATLVQHPCKRALFRACNQHVTHKGIVGDWELARWTALVEGYSDTDQKIATNFLLFPRYSLQCEVNVKTIHKIIITIGLGLTPRVISHQRLRATPPNTSLRSHRLLVTLSVMSLATSHNVQSCALVLSFPLSLTQPFIYQ